MYWQKQETGLSIKNSLSSSLPATVPGVFEVSASSGVTTFKLLTDITANSGSSLVNIK